MIDMFLKCFGGAKIFELFGRCILHKLLFTIMYTSFITSHHAGIFTGKEKKKNNNNNNKKHSRPLKIGIT